MDAQMTPKQLQHVVNTAARTHMPALAKRTGITTPWFVPTRLLLRGLDSSYPYVFQERDSMWPSTGKGFGGVIEKNREEGLQEIHSRIAVDHEEHAWIYLAHLGKWIDTTAWTGNNGFEFSVGGDQYLTTFLSHLFPQIERVHTHPDKVMRQAIACNAPMARLYRDVPNYHLIEGARPSSPDVSNYLQLASRSEPACTQTSSIVSHYGTTSFSFSSDGEKRFRAGGGSMSNSIDFKANLSKSPTETIKDLLALVQESQNIDARAFFDGKVIPLLQITFETLR